MSAERRVKYCQSCGRSVEVPHPEAQGHPYGWLHVSVSVPLWFNSASGKPYRWIGLFCSADCLGNGLAQIRADEEKTGHAYERE